MVVGKKSNSGGMIAVPENESNCNVRRRQRKGTQGKKPAQKVRTVSSCTLRGQNRGGGDYETHPSAVKRGGGPHHVLQKGDCQKKEAAQDERGCGLGKKSVSWPGSPGKKQKSS